MKSRSFSTRLRTRVLPALASAVALLSLARVSWAIDTEPPIENPVLRERYETLIHEIRCLVCQNQTIADSEAPLAGDLRREIRQKVVDGQSKQQVIDFLVARYGDFVLYRPRFEPTTWVLWGAPVALLVIGGFVFVRVLRGRMEQPLGEEEAK
jgi:cytochrome c-type biogenesis protein CcmH